MPRGVPTNTGLTSVRDCAWQCLACSRVTRARIIPAVCACGCARSFFPAETPSASRVELAPVDAKLFHVKRSKVESGLDRLLGGLPADGSLLVYGPPGSGKSRLTLRWASLLGPCALLSREMAPVELATCLATNGANSANLFHAATVGDAAEAMRQGRVRSVWVDSLQRLEPPELAEVFRRCTRGFWWLVSQINKKGEVSGTNDGAHDVSAVVRLEPSSPGMARATVEKTRFGGASGLVEEFALAPQAPQKAKGRKHSGLSG